jgi:uncharacterized membrane protein YhiD involved in acid resistance
MYRLLHNICLIFLPSVCVILFQSRKIANALEKKKRENYQEADVQVSENLKNNMKQVWEEEKQERMKQIQKKIDVSEDQVSIILFFFQQKNTNNSLASFFPQKLVNL